MTVLNFGSINIDHVYQVDHFVQPGETMSTAGYARYAGGKGFNQSIALSKAGAQVFHAGKIGRDGLWLKERLEDVSVHTDYIDIADTPTGHAVIQVDPSGENAIFLYGGANQRITGKDAQKVISGFGKGHYLLLQNEISAIPEILRLADEYRMRVIFNPAPMLPEVLAYPLECVKIFILNIVEGKALTGENEPEAILSSMRRRFPKAATILTLGDQGVSYAGSDGALHVPAQKVTPVDTTAAGDTFIGYFLADIIQGKSIESALSTACSAAALCVSKPGAADAIPNRSDLNP